MGECRRGERGLGLLDVPELEGFTSFPCASFALAPSGLPPGTDIAEGASDFGCKLGCRCTSVLVGSIAECEQNAGRGCEHESTKHTDSQSGSTGRPLV